MGLARTGFPFLRGDGDFAFAWRASRGFLRARTLRGHLFSLLIGFSSFCGSSSLRGYFLSRFFLVSILVNTSGARLNIFLSRNQKEIIERFGFEETKYERN
jgi:hypothetical protein